MRTREQDAAIRRARRRLGPLVSTDIHLMTYGGGIVVGNLSRVLHRALALARGKEAGKEAIGKLNAKLSGDTYRSGRAPS